MKHAIFYTTLSMLLISSAAAQEAWPVPDRNSGPIFVHPLPECLSACLPNCETECTTSAQGHNISGLDGYYAHIDLARVWWVVPASDNTWPVKSVEKTCLELSYENEEHNWEDALFTVEDWHGFYPEYTLFINANWFDVEEPFKSPHVNVCSQVLGLSISFGIESSSATEELGGKRFDALLLGARELEHWLPRNLIQAIIVPNSDIAKYNTYAAVSGFRILVDGELHRLGDDWPVLPKAHVARTAVGISGDQETMYVVVEQRGKFFDIETGGLTVEEVTYLMKDLGASDAILLDGSGSSQIAFYRNNVLAAHSKPGDVLNTGCDDQELKKACNAEELYAEEQGDPVRRHRPVPNFLGVRPLTGHEELRKRRVGGRHWTTTNLNLDVPESICFNHEADNCTKEGRLYTLAAARQACASLGPGWRLPTDDDWLELTRNHGGAFGDGDADGKTAYPVLAQGGSSGFDGSSGGKLYHFEDEDVAHFYDFGEIGYYWTTTEKTSSEVISYTFRSPDKTLLRETITPQSMISCRCVSD